MACSAQIVEGSSASREDAQGGGFQTEDGSSDTEGREERGVPTTVTLGLRSSLICDRQGLIPVAVCCAPSPRSADLPPPISPSQHLSSWHSLEGGLRAAELVSCSQSVVGGMWGGRRRAGGKLSLSVPRRARGFCPP